MGRLFWKLFFSFWVALLLAGIVVATVINIQRDIQQKNETPREARALAAGPRAAMQVDAGASVLQHGGLDALRAFLQNWDQQPRSAPLYAVDAQGHELLNREVPAGALAKARTLSERPKGSRAARWVNNGDEAYLLFVPASDERARATPRRRAPRWPLPGLMLVVGILGSLGFAAWLAWYLSRPIRHLRWAFENAAQGRLDTRVQARIGARRDEIADLGRDFDRMAQRLQQLMQAQQRLLHDVSHELRSPLARLQAAVGLARQNPARQQAMLARIERETERLDQLVGELLTLSRLSADIDGARLEEIDLIELVAAVVADAALEAEASERSIVYRGEGEFFASVHPEALQRAVENVVRNAVKYTAEQTCVEVIVDTAHGFVLRVCDHGPGVPESELETIFDPFYRGERTREIPGFGLGLTIARRAVEAEGGELRAFNREGGGLCVEITLPANRATQAAGLSSSGK